MVPFPTVGKYTQEAADLARDPERFAKAASAHVSQSFPGTLYPAPVSPERVEDKNQALKLAFEGNPVRAIKDAEGKPWFIGADVCAILGYVDSVKAIKAHCKSPELLKGGDSPLLGIPPRGMTIINRADVYRLIMRSQLPAAERFENWIVEEVIPAVMDHGGYLTPQATEQALADPDFIIGLATKLKEERARTAELEAQKAKLAQENTELAFEKQALTVENTVLKPKADLHDSLMEAGGAIEMGEAAKVLCKDYPGVGRNKLFYFLRWAGVLMYNDKRYNVPTQRFMNRGYFRVATKTRDFLNRDYIYPQVYVKPEGMKYIHKLVGKYYDGNTLR